MAWYNNYRALFIVLFACVVLVTVRAIGATTNPILKSEFIFQEAPFAECHASTIVETPKGLVCAWFGGTREGHEDVGIWLSRNDNGTWTLPLEVANGVQSSSRRFPCWNPVLFLPKSGPLLLFYKLGPSPSQWWGMLMRSSDFGKTWDSPQQLPKGILGPIKNKPIQLENGTILCGSSTEHDGWRVHFEASYDNAKTWEMIVPEDDGKRFGVIQPTLLQHSDGQIQAMMRSRSGKIIETWSKNGGKTWSPMNQSTLPNPNAGFDAMTLRGNRMLLVYNHTIRAGKRPRAREMLNIAISEDGKTWDAALILENTPDKEFSYPAVIQTHDGLVHIIYTWDRVRIKHVVLDPARLYLKSIQDGIWPN
ncbi:MAG: exo-alpha-sialidase [Sedimentisphaerales bacterium]|nr:exo-alpha-sialidase [Sedimentisphaerales bacterium]